jgi:alpha-tubulin suppressor-like RCC1 family protein
MRSGGDPPAFQWAPHAERHDKRHAASVQREHARVVEVIVGAELPVGARVRRSHRSFVDRSRSARAGLGAPLLESAPLVMKKTGIFHRVAPLALASTLASCAVDRREFEPDLVAAAGATGSSPRAEAPAPAGTGGAPPAMGGAGSSGTPVVSAPVLPLLANGAACDSAGRCESSRCEATVSGSSVCCALDCADDARCSADGASCAALARAAGQACGTGIACASGLGCMPAGSGSSACCSATCAAGEFCVEGGTRCAEPLRQTGAACTESGECLTGYCDLDRSVCRDNPCAGAIAGSYCARGGQCDAEGSCTFTGMGMVAAGAAHTCAVLTDGNVRCWGSNEFGQLGALLDQPIVGDDELPSETPGLVVTFGARRALQVSGGVGHTCVLLDDGNVRCWGRNLENQLTPTRADGDVFLPAGERAVQVDTGGGHSCALLASGNATCWGFNSSGQCGFGHNLLLTNVELGLIELTEPARMVSTGSADSCALLASGALTCWGRGGAALGYASAGDRPNPVGNVDVGGAVSFVSSGTGSTCAVIEGGFVRCWGEADEGKLGYAHPDDIGLVETPGQAAVLVASNGRALGGNIQLGGGGVVQVEVNIDSGHTCARFSGGAVRCWGDNDSGSLGYGHDVNIGDDETPAQAAQLGPDQLGGDVPLGRGALALAAGGRCAVLNDRSVICWGRNTTGQLGMPALFDAGTPDVTPAALIASGIGPVRIE